MFLNVTSKCFQVPVVGFPFHRRMPVDTLGAAPPPARICRAAATTFVIIIMININMVIIINMLMFLCVMYLCVFLV